MLVRFVIVTALALGFGVNALAEDFFSARVAVPDRSEGALEAAASSALSRVLIRVSGSAETPELPVAATAVADARNRMSLYTYEDSPEGLRLFVQFDGNFVKNVLRQSEATYWGESRPPVLLWLVIDEPFSRRFATVSEDGPLLRELSGKLADRGVNLRLPLLDLEDAATLTPEMVWQKVTPRILSASERYGTQHVLVGRYVQLSSGRQIADWLYLDSDQETGLQLEGNDPTPLLAGAVNLVLDAMVARYAVKLDAVPTFNQMAVAVTGVESYSDYRDVMALLKDIPVLEGIQVTRVEGDRLALRLTGLGSAEALERLLPPRSRLVVSERPGDRELLLRWGQP